MAKKVIVLIGAGGKTTALGLLARQSGEKKVLLTTTTHIFPLEGFPCFRDPAPEDLAQPGILCAGSSAKEGKLGILPQDLLEAALETTDLVIYEGDGAHRLPLKLHKPGEPVILPQTSHCLILAGLSALGRPIREAIHRYARNPDWAPDQPVGAAELAFCVKETAAVSGLPSEKIKVFLNQADTLTDPAAAMEAASQLKQLGLDTRYGSLQDPPEYLYAWVTEGECL